MVRVMMQTDKRYREAAIVADWSMDRGKKWKFVVSGRHICVDP